MKFRNTVALTFVAGLAMAGLAHAEHGAGTGHTNHGRRDGDHARGHARAAEAQEEHVKREEEKAKADGTVTAKEQAKIDKLKAHAKKQRDRANQEATAPSGTTTTAPSGTTTAAPSGATAPSGQ